MKKGKDTKRVTTKGKSSSTKDKPAQHEDLLTDVSHLKQPEAVGKKRESLGDRIRKARHARGLTLKDISSRTGIDIDTLAQVESNEVTPPLGQLVRLGKALDMRLGYLISPGVDKVMAVVRTDQRQPVSRYGEKRREQYGYLYESLAPEKGNRLMEPFIVTLLPTDVEEFSTHDGQEFLFVLEGQVKVQVGNEKELLRTGDAVYYDSNQPHLVKSAGGEKARILAVLYTEFR
jgi:quercetin dioxygenase-like cupin family protein/DNA-binding XRE family transcriptional regulator